MSDATRQSRDQAGAMRAASVRFAQAGHTHEAKRATGVAAMLAAHASGVTDPAALRAANRKARKA